MRILVIGGTQFIGRHFCAAAVASGHDVTVFHRGTHGSGQIEGAIDVLGDRKTDLGQVSHAKWDLVLDTCGYFPADVRTSCSALKDRCGRYLFVSTGSVYDSGENTPDDESAPFVPIGDPAATEITGDTYGYLKVLCEQEVTARFGDRSLIVRPGIVAGSYDPTNRFTYWVMRFAGGGQVLVPDVRPATMQLIDVRDLGAFMLTAAEQELQGPFNVVGPKSTFGEMIDTCAALNPSAEPVWVSAGKLEAAEIKLWEDLPLARPPENDRLFSRTCDAALAKGLRRRPLSETAQDVLSWYTALPEPPPSKTGMSRERELEFLSIL